MSNDSKYGALVITLKNGNTDSATKGVYLNDDLYITAKRDGNRIKLFFIGVKGKYLLCRNAGGSELGHIELGLLDEVAEHERKFRERQARPNKKNSVPKKKP